MKVLVCGGRDYRDRERVNAILMHFHKIGNGITHLIHGAANGADRLASEWANAMRVPQTPYRADWATHGHAAGPLRNAEMLRDGQPDFVIAFPGGRGTADMVRRAKDAGVKLFEVQSGTEGP